MRIFKHKVLGCPLTKILEYLSTYIPNKKELHLTTHASTPH